MKDELSCCCDGVDDGGVLSTEERENTCSSDSGDDNGSDGDSSDGDSSDGDSGDGSA